MTKEEILQDFFRDALRGESKTYNDHNWYSSSGIHGYIEGVSNHPYPLLTKPLSQYSIKEIKAFQNNSRSGTGQLWATGRYQIIPATLLSLMAAAGLKDNDLYNEQNQDNLGLQLLLQRKPIANYINGVVPDTLQNRQAAALSMSKIWASIGIPYAVNGKQKDQSYYQGGGDTASVSSDTILLKLSQLRKNVSDYLAAGFSFVKHNPLLTIGITVIAVVALYTICKTVIPQHQ